MIDKKKSIDRNAPVTSAIRRTRNLPHIQVPGATYAANTKTSEGKFLNPSERTIVFNSIEYMNGKQYELSAVVVMPDHFHFIIRPLEVTPGAYYSLPRIFHSIKSFTAHTITKVHGHVWQDEHWDHIIRTEEEYNEQIRYIENNPAEAGLVRPGERYPWMWHLGLGTPPTRL